jgi:outer membrane receptor protein involved in Fe transport
MHATDLFGWRQLASVVCLLLFPYITLAQGGRANLSGVVEDTVGGVLPGVSVTARQVETNQTRHATTDARGRYVFPDLVTGRHEVTADLRGFKQARVLVELTVGQEVEVKLTLAPSGVTENVEVTAEPALAVDTRSSTFGHLVTRSQIETQPLNGRDFSQLILLQPGTVQARSDQGDILTGKGAKVSVHGARTTQNAYLLDGTDILDALGRTAASAQGLVSGIESVQEFAVLTNTYTAEHGRAAGGVFNIVTRSGTNAYHGSVFEFFRNDALDSKNHFEIDKQPFTRNQFGASVSGPLKENRLFFFGAYEGLRDRLTITDVQSVPSLAARAGAFLPAGATINPGVTPYLALIPLPTIDNPTAQTGTYIGTFGQDSNLDTYNIRGDYMLSQDDSLFVRYTQNDSDILFLNAETFADFPNIGRNNHKFLTVGESRVFSNNVVNNFRFAFNRTTPREQPAPPNEYRELAFIPGQPIGDIFITGFKRFGTDRNTPREFLQDVIQVADDLTLVRGGHTLKFGGNVQRFDIRGNSASRNRGEFTINTFSDFLLGRSRDFVGLMPGQDDTIRHHRQWLFGFYVQDDWKLRPNFTINAGLRYEFQTVPNEVNGKITNVRFPTDPGVSVGPPLFENPSLKNFAPRVGFVYAPDATPGWLRSLLGSAGERSIRGGFGIYYEPLLYSVYGNMTFKHPPYFTQIRINNAPFPNVYPLLASGQGLVDTFAIQFDPDSTYVMQYNGNVQRAIRSNVLITVGYVGSRGTNLWREADFNNAIPLTPDGTRFPTTGTPVRRNPNFANVRYKVADAGSLYNSLQLAVLARGRKFQGQLSYTLGKSTDDQSSSLGRTEFANGQARTVDPYNLELNHGLSDFDVRHTLTASFSYDLPYGLQANGIITAASGVPVSPIFTFDHDRDATTDNEQRPDWAPGVNRTTRVSDMQLFDPSLFVVPAPGTRGNVGRNVIPGPGLFTVDASLVKTFFAKGSRALQARIEVFNLFNRANFAIPTVGNLTVFLSPTERNPTAGQITSTSTPARQIQLALRLSF